MAITYKNGLLGSDSYQNLTVSVKPYCENKGNTEGSLSDPVETTRWPSFGGEDIVQATRNSGFKFDFIK